MERFVQPYDKECMKMAMLKHEETFKEQVYELHRLYQIQKILMKNIQSSRHNYNYNYQEQKNKTDLEQPATTKDYDHATQTLDDDQEFEEDESDIELTLAPTSFNRRRSMSNKPESSDSVLGFSSSSTGSSNTQKVEIITRENSSFLSGNRRNNSSSDRSIKQPPWMYQVLTLFFFHFNHELSLAFSRYLFFISCYYNLYTWCIKTCTLTSLAFCNDGCLTQFISLGKSGFLVTKSLFMMYGDKVPWHALSLTDIFAKCLVLLLLAKVIDDAWPWWWDPTKNLMIEYKYTKDVTIVDKWNQ
ncbi:hypothetical protein L1987_46952 [Smallanthus sonchifolius]|uniref:Uncharacterized protein n=1 Tax=Smallanthus sonchifolius TaxID=185202 RepID=A0ACB9G179_9ASTR|nr:hypothetical protein L1987_46952 [Smallanthus sonchifolius]